MPIGAIISGIFGNSAADQQSKALQSGIDLQTTQYNNTKANLAPYLVGGNAALDEMLSLYGVGSGVATSPDPNAVFAQPISSIVGAPPSPTDASLQTSFLQSPGYQYLLSQSGKAIQNAGTGTTGAISGNTLKALQSNATGLASQDWNNFYNNLVQNYGQRYQDIANQRSTDTGVLSNLVSGGQNAAANLGGLGNQSVTGISNSLATLGSAQALGTTQLGNSLGSAFSSLFGGGSGSSGSSALSFLFGNSGGSSGGGYGPLYAGNDTASYGGGSDLGGP